MAYGDPMMSASVPSGSARSYSARIATSWRATQTGSGPTVHTPISQTASKPRAPMGAISSEGTVARVTVRPWRADSSRSHTRVLIS